MRGSFPENVSLDQVGWCMCSHHACYHDEFQPGQVPSGAGEAVAGQENERPKLNREPLSPVQDMGSFRMPSNLDASLDLNFLEFPAAFSCSRPDAANPQQQGVTASPGQDNSMPDTMSWGSFLQPQGGHADALPPIPPQCLMASQPPSTASSSQTRYLRPFAGKGLQTLSGVSATRPLESLLEQRTGSLLAPGVSKEPAQASNIDQRAANDILRGAAGSARPAAQLTQEVEDGLSPSTVKGISPEDFQHLSSTVQSHEQRLDRLENVSFSVAGHEECQEKHDHADLRVTELESRVEEVEKLLSNDTSSLGSTRRITQRDVADDATASVVSVSSSITNTPTRRSEMFSQLQALQARVNQLQASSPSYNNPWELEVVFLPFPLKGIWMEAHDFPSQTQPGAPGSNADEWTQLPNTASRPRPDSPIPYARAAVSQSPGSDWLLPRACAPGRMIDRRLRSRGLIKTVSVKGPDARSVQLAINTAFSDVLRIIPTSKSSRALIHRSANDEDPRLSSALGLQQTWVPLRKIHKDSRLRFLAPAEMVTPTLWDVAFLVSSIVMKASGVQRLYVTQREAYLQDHPLGFEAFESGWTWRKLRELTRVYPDSQSSSNGEIPEADALEECWTWNDRLDDEPLSQPSSLSLRQAQTRRSLGRSSTSSPQQFFTGVQSPSLSASPGALRAHSPLVLKERKGSRPPHVRTNSIPPTAPILHSPSQPKRRVSSYGNVSNQLYERRSSPFFRRSSPRLPMTTPANSGSVMKRRQSTRSPSLIPRNTPRWSRSSMSRSPSLAPFGPGFGDDRGDRRTTPFCYATPYSNAPPEPYPGHRAGSRGPIPPPNACYPDDDEDMDDDRGSSTDPYDSEMTNEADADEVPLRLPWRDVDPDIDVYEDEPDELDHVDTDGEDEEKGEPVWRDERLQAMHLAEQGHGHGQAQALATTLPEDEPWPGIEDKMSDGENVDPLSVETNEVDVEIDDAAGIDDGSDVSSQPSEYPSTQRAWHVTDDAPDNRGDSKIGFKIHEDGDADITGMGTQWD